MATQKKTGSVTTAKRPRARRWPWLLLVLFFAFGAVWWLYGGSIRGNSETATAYMARVACSCRFVAGRELDSCADDKLAGMELVTLSQDVEAQSVTATMPLIASDTATYREGYGCVLEEWER